MTYPCESCDGTGETTVSHDNDPQRDTTKDCTTCGGTGNEPCYECSTPAALQCWARDEDHQRTAHLRYLCEQHGVDYFKAGLVVLTLTPNKENNSCVANAAPKPPA